MTTLRRICVYCGSRLGKDPAFLAAARELGGLLGRAQIGVVYGGASIGLMGAVADAVLDAGGEVIGVMPQRMIDREIAHPRLTAMHVVDSMHERKAKMADLSDGFIAMPGGFGTLDELFEIITWAQLGLHGKPVGVLDVAGYFAPLFQFAERAMEEGFVPREHSRILLRHANPSALVDAMRAYVPAPIAPKAISPSQR